MRVYRFASCKSRILAGICGSVSQKLTLSIRLLSQRQLNMTSLGKLSSYYAIPYSFWASGDNGSFLSSTSIDEIYKVISRGTICLAILKKEKREKEKKPAE